MLFSGIFLFAFYILQPPSRQSIISIFLQLLLAFYIALISADFAIYRQKCIQIDDAFQGLHKEIKTIRSRVASIYEQLDRLEESWKKILKNQWIGEKTIVREAYSQDTRFVYQYLPNNALKVIQSLNFDTYINGFQKTDEINYYHEIQRFYFQSIKTSEKSERIENLVNDVIDKICNYIEDNPNTCFNQQSKILCDRTDFKNTIIYFEKLRFKAHISLTKPFTQFEDCEFNEVISKFESNSQNIKSWEEFVAERIKEIRECFEMWENKEKTHCKNLKMLDTFTSFSAEILDRKKFILPGYLTNFPKDTRKILVSIAISAAAASWIMLLLILSINRIISIISGSLIGIALFMLIFAVLLIGVFILLSFVDCYQR